MEALALHEFGGSRPDELAFKKGQTLHIISMDEEPNWYKARLGNREGLVPKNYLHLNPNPWFIPNCTRLEAEARLSEKDPKTDHYIQPDGAFILRHSENNPGQFSISVKEGVFVLHFRVFYEEPGSYFIWTSKFPSINALIDHHRNSTIYGLRTLLLRDCMPSNEFGPQGIGNRFQSAVAAASTNGAANNSANRNMKGSAQKVPPNNMQSMDQPHNMINMKPGLSQQTSSVPRAQDMPANYNKTNQKLPEGVFSSQRCGMICEALFDFKPGFKEEMGFNRGNMIRILAEEDENWWLGEIIDPQTHQSRNPPTQGLFPSNYVRLIESNVHQTGNRNWPQQPGGMQQTTMAK